MGSGWVFLAVLLALIAAIMRQGALLLVACFLLLVSAVAFLWAKYSLRRLEYSRKLSASRAFFGDEVTLELTVANRKILPLPWLDIREELDEELTPQSVQVSPSHKPKRVYLHNLFSLGWYHQVTRIYHIKCQDRGYFSVGPTTIRSGDFFGFRNQQQEVGNPAKLLVYPRVVPLEALGIPSREPFGDLRLRRHLFEDPVRAVGIRDYAPGDPMKRIHWKATARAQRLQTKVFEHTTAVDMALFLDIRTVEPPFWAQVPQLLETAIIATASIANYANDQGYRLGLYINQTYRGNMQLMRFPPSGHPDQFMRILEALAQVLPPEQSPIERVLQREGAALPWASTLVVVTAVPTEGLLGTLLSYRRAGRPVALVVVGGEKPSVQMAGLPLYYVPAEIPWEKVESITANPVAI